MSPQKSLTLDEYRAQVAADMAEATLQSRVEQLARELGWLIYHTHDSRRSQKGFPDLVMARRGRLVWRELKTMKGKVTPEQGVWLDALTVANADVGVWRPCDLLDETILSELTAERDDE